MIKGQIRQSAAQVSGLPGPGSLHGQKTKSRRTSFKNELGKRFSSKYRDAENDWKLMGEKEPLGKAFGKLA